MALHFAEFGGTVRASSTGGASCREDPRLSRCRSEAERTELQRLLRRRGVGQALAQRARVVLACAEPGATNLGVSKALGVSRQTVATWRERFAAHRLNGLPAERIGGRAALRGAAQHG